MLVGYHLILCANEIYKQSFQIYMKFVKFIIIIIVIFFLAIFAYSQIKPKSEDSKETNPPKSQTQNDSPKIISTKPDPLEEATVPAVDSIEITFNKPLQNPSEFKVRIEPKIDFKIELSSDKETGKIILEKPLDLGMSYALYIGRDTKFDGVGEWGMDKEFHFRTVSYKGI